jgi:hypothetical protein
MFDLTKAQKISVILIIGIFLSAGFIPTMSSDEIKSKQDITHSISIDVATKVATGKLRELEKNEFTIQESTKISNENGESLFYVFTLNPQGYLVVCASYDLPPVIAYSLTSNFETYSATNPLYDMLYADITVRLEHIDIIAKETLEERHIQWDVYTKGDLCLNGRFEQWPPEGSTPTEGWVLTNWNQNAPYNNLCPLDLYHGGRSYAGCPAVTMAQILNYHNTTCDVQFNDGDDYYHNYYNDYWIDNDYTTYGFPSFPQLNTYLNTLQSHYEDQIPPTTTDKAAIIFACGVAATQVYDSTGSGTFGVDQAYDAYQRFGCTTVELLDESDPDMYQKLSNNMKDALPAHLAIVNEGWTSGHNLVVDGYNTDDYYHLNFGWGGSADGWYLIPDELPYQLTVIEGVIVDILKEDTGTPDLTCSGSLVWTNAVPYETVSGSFTVSNIGETSSYLDWEITEWPTWGSWTFTPTEGNNLKPEDGPVTVNVEVVVPEGEDQQFTGNVTVVNIDDTNDYATIPVSLQTGNKIHENLFCNGSLNWADVKPGATMTGSFTVENVGAAATNLSWEITGWPEWGTWTFTPSEGNHLTPEDGPITVSVSVVAPRKWNKEFTGQISIVNTENSSDNDTISVSLATPYVFHPPILGILQALMERFPHAFPLLRLLLNL